VHGNSQEDYRIRLIRVQLVVMEYFLPGRISQSAIMLRSTIQLEVILRASVPLVCGVVQRS
jgi:hypothetical protein